MKMWLWRKTPAQEPTIRPEQPTVEMTSLSVQPKEDPMFEVLRPRLDVAVPSETKESNVIIHAPLPPKESVVTLVERAARDTDRRVEESSIRTVRASEAESARIRNLLECCCMPWAETRSHDS